MLALAWLVCLSAALPGAAADRRESINEVDRIDSDGARLWLLLRGADDRAPVAIWLHGGPGGAESPLFRLYNRDLERALVVVYYDQRGAGRSYDADADAATLTIAQHLDDLDRVVDFVRTRLGAERVSLIGHSWGSALGLMYAHQHPDKVRAFVGVGQLVSELNRQRAQLAFALTHAHATRDKGAIAALTDVGQPPFAADEELLVEHWVDHYGGVFHDQPSFLAALAGMLVRGYVWPWQIPGFIHANEVSLHAMSTELASLDLGKTVTSVAVPVLFALGCYDRQVDARLAAAYFDQLDAPVKRLIWFTNSAHNIPFEEPRRFNEAVRDFLLGAGSAAIDDLSAPPESAARVPVCPA